MQRHTGDDGVYIRSMAARGHLGGLASAAREAIRLIDASGRDRCLLETVGVGQSELEVMQTVDTTVVVTTPVAGDSVQILKAGILEIADVFVVNKADVPGAAKVVRELRDLVRQTKGMSDWKPPVVQTTATNGAGSTSCSTPSSATMSPSRRAASWSGGAASGCGPRSRRSLSNAPPTERGVSSKRAQWVRS